MIKYKSCQDLSNIFNLYFILTNYQMKKIVRLVEDNATTQKTTNNLFQQNFKIYLRIKPILQLQQTKQCIRMINKKKVQISSPYYSSDNEKTYNYEEVFNGKVTNNEVFQKTMTVPILNALSGYNSTVFIYGMTGAGKTYTMFGDRTRNEEGIVDITLNYMFNEIKSKKDIKTQVFVSFFQIYNENIKDLLQQNTSGLSVMQDPIKGIFVNELKQQPVDTEFYAKQIIRQGLDRRAMNATKSNEVSSRSHAILQFLIRRYVPKEGDTISVLQSKFFMIDLAGNQKSGNNESKRFIQGVNINKSLLTLGKCISILAEQKKNSFIPFRDSKLTRILKQSLGGNSKTVMIACISSQRKYYEQTLNTLKYSNIAKRIKNRGIKNNIKLISKNELPDQRQCVTLTQKEMNKQDQKRVSDIMSKLICSIEEKLQMQKIKEELQTAKVQNQRNIKLNISVEQSRRFIQQINILLAKINEEYHTNMRYAESLYQSIINSVHSSRNKQDSIIDSQRKQIMKLQEIINDQHNRIKQLQIQRDQKNKEEINTIRTHNASMMTITNKQNKNPKFTVQRTKEKKRHQLSIYCPGTEESIKNKQQNHHQLISKHVQSQQIYINLNNQSTKHGKEQFVKRLKQTQKRAKGQANNDDITRLIDEQQINQYELSNIEQSMLRKLRFFQRDKSLQKSQSLGGNSIRGISAPFRKYINKY